MSRTYRLRHLPYLEGGALKYVDATTHTADRILDERVVCYYAHVIYNVPCIYGDTHKIDPHFRNSHSRCLWKAGFRFPWHSEQKFRSELGIRLPVAGAAWHPWVGSQSVGNVHKRAECRRGHRAIRRHARILLTKLSLRGFDWDGCDEGFKTSREEIDPWAWD